MYLFAEEGAFLSAVEPVKDNAWCGRVTSTDGTCSWYVIAPGLQGQNFDALCTPYDENYPLRLADYTDALWNAVCWTKRNRRYALQIPPLCAASWNMPVCCAPMGKNTQLKRLTTTMQAG